MSSNSEITFLQWALPKMDYRWSGFRKPRSQVLKRIRGRMQQLGLSGGYSEYRGYLETHPEEWERLDRLCDITISKFFRDRNVWEYLRDQVLSSLLQTNRSSPIKIWSIGCCNGEEAYSLAMLCEQLTMDSDQSNRSSNISILATDRNREVLERAQKGRYSAGSLKELNENEIITFFRSIDDSDKEEYQVFEKLKHPITFEQRDIRQSLPDRVFDLVLCRNLVFTYFTQKRQRQFLERLNPHLKAHGFLVVGNNETLPPSQIFRAVSQTHPVYRKRNWEK